ncbi:MAG: hypothetical protein M0R30_04705 [Methanoregula sp.]|jgi:chromosome segregation ATPase|uniref:hypothetical protein n=1 Tax=Methanoregula sp. TaxID=2052170 RepID=UPI0025E214EE|nr:hypothetical protein [Methanoregula sp.]MCK9630921.1 hypothetical protein [Methanoregula sp.]
MNNSLSDGNENIVDIFVLSTSTSDSPVQAADLEKPGYRVTFFTDGTNLFETLRSGKPNLLICDSVTFPEEAYGLCRAIKADYDLWVVPVLVLTGASNLSHLLHVLDCNADNFISYPYDPSYLSSLIEGMLATPVERQTPEQIKTQFKIQHDEQQFVVTADRRKLLEFLLSSFEIAVNRSAEINRITGEKENLSLSLNQSEERARDRARSIENLNATVREKDQAISTFIADAEAKDRQLSENAGEIQRLNAGIESGKTSLAGAEDQISRLIREAEDFAQRHAAEIDDLRQQLQHVSADLETANTGLQSVKASLASETAQRIDVEARLLETTVRKEESEKSVQALSLECEQLRSSLDAEKAHAQSAEDEIQTLTQVKNESEQALTRTIDELKDTEKQLGEDLLRQRDELGNANKQIHDLENQLATVTTEKEQVEAELRNNAAISEKAQSDLRADAEKTRAELSDKEREVESLNAAVRETREARDKTARDLQALAEELRSVSASLDQEKEQHRETEERLTSEIRERDALLQSLRGEHQTVNTAFEEHKSALAQSRTDLEAVIAVRSDLESRLESATFKIHDLESELHAVLSASAEAGQQVRALTDELEQAHADLDESREQYKRIEEASHGEDREKELVLLELQNASRERESLQLALASERQLRREAESEQEHLLKALSSAKTEGKNNESSLTATVRELSADLESSQTIRRDLEEQVATLSREKQLAEDKMSRLSDEIDQARAALADEWEDHMNAQERLDVAVHEKQDLEQSLQQSGDLESEKAKKRSLIVKGPDLPVITGTPGQSLHVYPGTGGTEPQVPRITNVEDLFEEEGSAGEPETEDVPAVSIIREPSDDDETANDSPDTFSTTPPGHGPGEPGYEPDEEEESEDERGEIADEEQPSPESGEYGTDIPPGIAFNRAQWYDILKWAHHSGTLTQEQRMQIVRMGRLIQKGRKLTHKQEEQVREMIVLVKEQGYRFT